MAYGWTFGKDPLKLEKFWERSIIKYDKINYGVMMYQSCPHWLKITVRKELGRLVQKYRIAI